MVRPEVIRRRLDRLTEYLGYLKMIRSKEKERFLEDPILFGSAERFLQTSIESLSDIGAHVIAELDLGSVESYADVPARLEAAGYLEHTQKERWTRMIGFRNILVHDYLDVDREIVWDILWDHMADLEDLARVFARFL